MFTLGELRLLSQERKPVARLRRFLVEHHRHPNSMRVWLTPEGIYFEQ